MTAYPHWTTAELRILRQHYPRGGSAACVPVLPRHSRIAIQRKALDVGLRAGQVVRDTRRTALTTAQTVALIRALRRGIRRGDLSRLAARLALAPWIIKSALRRLAKQPVDTGPRTWTTAQEQCLRDHHDWPIRRLATRLNSLGPRRTPRAVAARLARRGIARDTDHCTAAGLARLLGVNQSTVARWIHRGRLAAQAYATDYPARRQGNRPRPHWSITRASVRDLLRADPALRARLARNMPPAGRLWLADALGDLPSTEHIKDAPTGRATHGVPAHWMEAA